MLLLAHVCAHRYKSRGAERTAAVCCNYSVVRRTAAEIMCLACESVIKAVRPHPLSHARTHALASSSRLLLSYLTDAFQHQAAGDTLSGQTKALGLGLRGTARRPYSIAMPLDVKRIGSPRVVAIHGPGTERFV